MHTPGLAFDYYVMTGQDQYTKIESFNRDEIDVINWDSQIFRIKDPAKIARIDSIVKYGGGFKSYFAVYHNTSFLYNVSVVPTPVSSNYCSACPKAFADKENKLFSDSADITFYFGSNTNNQYYRLKDSLRNAIW